MNLNIPEKNKRGVKTLFLNIYLHNLKTVFYILLSCIKYALSLTLEPVLTRTSLKCRIQKGSNTLSAMNLTLTFKKINIIHCCGYKNLIVHIMMAMASA